MSPTVLRIDQRRRAVQQVGELAVREGEEQGQYHTEVDQVQHAACDIRGVAGPG